MPNDIETEMITACFRFDVLSVASITFLIPGVVAALTGGRWPMLFRSKKNAVTSNESLCRQVTLNRNLTRCHSILSSAPRDSELPHHSFTSRGRGHWSDVLAQVILREVTKDSGCRIGKPVPFAAILQRSTMSRFSF